MADDRPWIAIVDDDLSVLKALSRLLRARAFEVKAYASAREFLGSLSGGLPACVVLDLQMPVMSGLELLEELKDKRVPVPAIVITAYAEADVRERCRAAGAAFLLTKPLQDASLFAAIDRAKAQPAGERAVNPSG